MKDFGLVIAILGFMVSCVALVYPFKPFGTRRTALGATVVSFMFGYILANPSAFETKGVADSTVQSSSPATAVQLPPDSQVENEAGEPQVPQAPAESELQDVREYFDTRQWSLVAFQVMVIRKRGFEIEELVQQLEQDTLKIVKPLPASDYSGNLAGYELLAVLRPDNPKYKKKASAYRAKQKQARETARAKIKKDREAAVSRLRKKVDKIDGITWYHHSNQPRYINSRSTVYLYIGRVGEYGRLTLRMKTVYTASDWLFVSNVAAWHDGVKEPFVSGDFERDNNSKIWEWRDDVPTGHQIEVLKSLANAKEAILRFEGNQYRKDIKLSAGDKKAIREVLLAYEVMTKGR